MNICSHRDSTGEIVFKRHPKVKFKKGVSPLTFFDVGFRINSMAGMGDILHTRFLVFDLEMTGLSPERDSIIEIGAVPLEGVTVDGDYFFTPVQPYTNISSESKKIHGLDGDDVWMAPPAEVALGQFFDLMRGRVLVGQNPRVDLAFLWRAAKTVGGNFFQDWAIDVSRLFTKIFPLNEGLSLEKMARKLGIYARREFHNALGDAILTAKIFGALLPELQRKGIMSIDELISAGKVKMM